MISFVFKQLNYPLLIAELLQLSIDEQIDALCKVNEIDTFAQKSTLR